MILLAILVRQHGHNVQQNVQTHHVGQLQGAHGVVAAQLHAVVHVLNAADEGTHDHTGLVQHGQQSAVDDKAGLIVGQDHGLAQALAHFLDVVQDLLLGEQAEDDLAQLHLGHGGEEVHADHTGGTLRGGGQSGQRDGGGIGGEDGFGGAQVLQLGEHGLLGLQVLVNGLDDQVGLLGTLHAAVHGQMGQSLVHGLLGHAALADLPGQGLFDDHLGALHGGLLLIIQGDIKAAGDGVLGDTAAHQTGADNKDILNRHCNILFSFF